jgi:glycosyltransferase involved in cell wall biosynthesis
MKNVLLIPAYNPDQKIIQLINGLNQGEFKAILVVNDGSLPEKQEIFSQLSAMESVIVLDHAINQGKGAALKTGFNYTLSHYKDCPGVVTADADGQHSLRDIIKTSQTFVKLKDTLVIGTRAFDSNVPLRSSFGNKLTRLVMKLLFKIDINDTQSGLRAIPMNLLDLLLSIPFKGYEFETEMLLVARQNRVELKEIEIETIYEDDNASSSFNPIVDSVKIYFVLFRYVIASLLTAVVDYFVFFISFAFFGKIFLCTYLARFVALFINFIILKRFVFHSRENNAAVLMKYLLLVVITGFLSSSLIDYFNNTLGLSIVLAKITAELLLYFGIFLTQKEFVFRRGAKKNG